MAKKPRVVRPSPTVPDVAKRAGVSTATAARALGGYGSVSDDTRTKVAAIADEMDYRPNSLARSLITKTTRTLGVVVADIENPFFTRALRGIADAAERAGYEIVLANTDEELSREHSAISMLTERQVDGLVVCPTDPSERDHLATMIQRGVPVVLLDRKIRGLKADSVGIDNRAAARAATEYLTERGHERIAVLIHPAGSKDGIGS